MGGWAIWGHSKGFSAGFPALPWLCVCRVIVLLNGEPSPHFDVQCSLKQVFVKDVSLFWQVQHLHNTMLPAPCLTVGMVLPR